MKLYFVKYMGTSGEIKVGDKAFHPTTGKIVDCKYQSVIDHLRVTGALKEYHLIKMFVCSRNIKTGDTVRFRLASKSVEKELKCVDDYMDVNIHGDNMKTVVLEDGDYKIYTTPDTTNQCYKIIGTVSPEATWVKEWMEFDKEDLLAQGVGVNWSESEPNTKFKIRCSQCNTFH